MNIRPFSPAKSILLLSSAILFINVTSLLGQIEISNATNIADILAYLNSLGGILNPTNIGNQLIQGTANICASRGPTCAIWKMCNITFFLGQKEIDLPTGFCAGGSSSINIDFSQPASPTILIQLKNPIVTLGDNCFCNNCNIQCRREPLAGCDLPPSTTPPNQCPASNVTKISGMADTCIYYRPKIDCFGSILCNVTAESASFEDIPTACIQGQAKIVISNSLTDGSIIGIKVANGSLDVGPGTESCQCKVCQINCKNIPLAGCPGSSTNSSTPSPSPPPKPNSPCPGKQNPPPCKNDPARKNPSSCKNPPPP